MTRRLARLADISYRYRGRMVLAWIAALAVLIFLGTSLAGEYEADYNTPGSESKAASELTESAFDGYSGLCLPTVDGTSLAANKAIYQLMLEVTRLAQPTKPIRLGRCRSHRAQTPNRNMTRC